MRKQTWESTVNLLLTRSWQTIFSEEGSNGFKKSKVEKWQLPEVSLDVNDIGDVVLLSCKICKISCDKRPSLVLGLSIFDWFN